MNLVRWYFAKGNYTRAIKVGLGLQGYHVNDTIYGTVKNRGQSAIYGTTQYFGCEVSIRGAVAAQ